MEGLCIESSYTFRARNDWAALVLTLLDHTVLTDRFRERAHAEVAHQHFVVACAVQAWFVRQNSVALCVVIVVVVTPKV